MIKYFFGFGSIILALTMNSCNYNNAQDILSGTICDTSSVSYSSTISGYMNNYCNGCHGGASPSAGISTEGYSNVKALVVSGQLWGTMNHSVGYSPMPKGTPKLDECTLTKLKAWINAGAPNN